MLNTNNNDIVNIYFFLSCTSMVWEIWVQSQVASYQRLLKWYLIPPCLTLSNIRYISRVKWSNPGKGVAPSPAPWCSSYWKGSLQVTLDYGHQLYLYGNSQLIIELLMHFGGCGFKRDVIVKGKLNLALAFYCISYAMSNRLGLFTWRGFYLLFIFLELFLRAFAHSYMISSIFYLILLII